MPRVQMVENQRGLRIVNERIAAGKMVKTRVVYHSSNGCAAV